MHVYVCNFCGGDHGATECRESVCESCCRSQDGCRCEIETDTFSAGDTINRIWEHIGEIVPEEDWDALDEKFGQDYPIELCSHVVATYPITGWNSYLNELFPPPKDDGKTYNASRKLGNCYFWAFTALEEQTYPQVSDEEVFLVQGFLTARGGGFTGHGWLETGDKVINCGSDIREFSVHDKSEFYSRKNVKHPVRYTMEEARKKLLENNDFAQWIAPPAGLPLNEDLKR
jgi:hypothetical protein